ncbi:hypothetical protein [Cyanobium sp. Morenito 9A2]|uniref:hypothetical protein n=1 Tax=Cyanobium sp. Morenito 9A2 TaxID=2823718 RepID=UPI0020CD9C15|nr:hypothetical protein [Cyanobium sp. Morenito 9A2]MCP9849579.1 hypothetical protein [Cyanobium sp. Morenito 9A2]
MAHWCHAVRQGRVSHSVSRAKRDFWQQVAHVDAIGGNSTVSQSTPREARRLRNLRVDGKAYVDQR